MLWKAHLRQHFKHLYLTDVVECLTLIDLHNLRNVASFQVWRGYQGNVYFEPIHVNRANYIVPEPPPTPAIENYSDTLQQIMKRNKRKHHSPPRSVARNSTAASEAAAGSTVDENAASHRGSPVVKGQRKMALLDESAILDGENEALREDIIWLVGQQSIGSLCINESTSSKRVPPYQKHRICKGSVAHKIYALRNKEIPLLSLKSGTSRSGAASPKAPTPRGPVDSIQTSYNSFPELSVLRSRRKAQSSQEDGTHDLISARPPALERMNFEDGALHFSARPFPSCGLLGKVRTSRNVSPRRPQHRVS